MTEHEDDIVVPIEEEDPLAPSDDEVDHLDDDPAALGFDDPDEHLDIELDELDDHGDDE